MTPLAVFAVAVGAFALSAFRWVVLSQRGQFDIGAEWPFWLFCVGAIAVAIVFNMAGRAALLMATPFVLIPVGAYLLQRANDVQIQFGLDLRRTGWVSLFGGVLWGIVALASVLMRT